MKASSVLYGNLFIFLINPILLRFQFFSNALYFLHIGIIPKNSAHLPNVWKFLSLRKLLYEFFILDEFHVLVLAETQNKGFLSNKGDTRL
jgi:hypothetical protein